jgi:hypothetical protein
MHLISSWKQGLILGGIALLAIVAVVALAHQSSPAPQASFANSASPNAATLANPEPVSRDTEPAFANRESPQDAGPPTVYAISPFAPSEPRAAIPAPAVPLMETAPPVVQNSPVAENSMVARGARGWPAARRRRVYYSRRRRHGRPFSHSVAIVGGSAAGGALIGGLAGGGKGAGIGALAGGAGGLIYDRATAHKK